MPRDPYEKEGQGFFQEKGGNKGALPKAGWRQRRSENKGQEIFQPPDGYESNDPPSMTGGDNYGDDRSMTGAGSKDEAYKRAMSEKLQDGGGDEGRDDFMQQNAENSAAEADTLDGYFKNLNEEDKRKPRGPGQKMRMALRKRRNKILIGIVSAVLPVIGSFISLPYQLTNLSSLLEQFHFSINEDVGESRTTRLIRYLRYPDNPERRRLGIVKNRIADRVETKMRALGYDPGYSQGRGFLEYVDVDNTNRRLIQDLESDGLRVDNTDAPDGKTRFYLQEGDGVSARTRRQNLRSIVRRPGYAKISALQARLLIRRGGITLRPMGLLPRGTSENIATRVRAWKDERTNRRVNGVEDGPVARVADADEDAPDSEQAERDAQNERLEEDAERRRAAAGDGTPAERIRSTRARLLGGAVAGIGGIGLLCTIQQLDRQADELKWVNRALPKMRMGMDLVAAGNQIKEGRGFTAEEVGVWTEEVQEVATLYVGDGEAPQTASIFGQEAYAQGSPELVQVDEDDFIDLGPAINAKGIRSELNLSGGAEQQSSARYSDRDDLLSRLGSLFGFVPSEVCSVATNPWFGAFVTVATLGTMSTADFIIDGAILAAGALWIDDLVRIAAGVEVDPEAVGADLGNHANDGVRLAANEQAISYGGRELTGTETIAWESRRDTLIAEENSKKPFLERYFSFNNPRSLASMSMYSMPQGFTASLTNIFTSPFTAMAGLVSPVKAQGSGYDYGFPRFGFSIGELENIDYENPYENAEILDRDADIDELHDTIGRDCFGLDITEDENGGSYATNEASYYFGDDGLIENCRSARSRVSNEIFTRYRFYVLDTMLMTSIACYEGLETFCEELGFGASSSNPGVNVEGSIVGNPYETSVDVACDPRTADLGVHNGYNQQNLLPLRLCALPNIPSNADESEPGNSFYIDGANGFSIVSSRVSGAWYALGESARLDGVSLRASSTFRSMAKQEQLWVDYGMDTNRVATPGNSPHQAGAAIDFQISGSNNYVRGATCSNPANSPDPAYEWLVDNASQFGFGQYAAEAWHWDPSTAGNRCYYTGIN